MDFIHMASVVGTKHGIGLQWQYRPCTSTWPLAAAPPTDTNMVQVAAMTQDIHMVFNGNMDHRHQDGLLQGARTTDINMALGLSVDHKHYHGPHGSTSWHQHGLRQLHFLNNEQLVAHLRAFFGEISNKVLSIFYCVLCLLVRGWLFGYLFEIGPHYLVQAGLKLEIFLSPLPGTMGIYHVLVRVL